MKFPHGKVNFALNPKLSIPISALVIGSETYSDPESKVQPIFTSLVCSVWDCEMVINDAWLVFWSHCGICMF